MSGEYRPNKRVSNLPGTYLHLLLIYYYISKRVIMSTSLIATSSSSAPSAGVSSELVTRESTTEGAVSWKIYHKYCKSTGGLRTHTPVHTHTHARNKIYY